MSNTNQPQKISEVIERLKAILDFEGDIPVFINYDEEWQWFNRKEFILKEDQDGETVLIIE